MEFGFSRLGGLGGSYNGNTAVSTPPLARGGVQNSLIVFMYYVYLLKNSNGQFYIGYSKDLKRRLAEHRTKKVKTTERLGYSHLLYYEAYPDEFSAKNREQNLNNLVHLIMGCSKG